MKQTKVIIAATIATIIIMLSCAFMIPTVDEVGSRGEFSPRLTVAIGKK